VKSAGVNCIVFGVARLLQFTPVGERCVGTVPNKNCTNARLVALNAIGSMPSQLGSFGYVSVGRSGV
jgi:hypothetical protein